MDNLNQKQKAVTHKVYVRDENGVLRVGAADISLDSVVIAFQDGNSPESIQLQYPVLTLEEVYGEITYYLANRLFIDDYLKRQENLWTSLRQSAEQSPSPVVIRLRSVRHSVVGEPT